MDRGQASDGTLQGYIDYADNLLLLTCTTCRKKPAGLEENVDRVGLKLNPQKCKWLKVSSRNN